jgi:HlyD family secretion protein
VTVRTEAEIKQQTSGEGSEGEGPSSGQNSPEDDKNVEVIFINNGGVAKLMRVKTGLSDFENIEITNDLSDTTEIVSGPFIVVSKRLKDGDAIIGKNTGEEKEAKAEEDTAEETSEDSTEAN